MAKNERITVEHQTLSNGDRISWSQVDVLLADGSVGLSMTRDYSRNGDALSDDEGRQLVGNAT